MHMHSSPEAIPLPMCRFEHMHMDLVGPLPRSGGFTHLFTVVSGSHNSFAGGDSVVWYPCTNCTASLFTGWIQRFGVPSKITLDRGAQFTSGLLAAHCQLLCILHVQTTAYHPQANGLGERFHRRFKEALCARAASSAWISHLPWVMLGIRTAVPVE